MIKLSIEDFLFEVKDEILSYEELGKQKAEEWEKNFMSWLNNSKIKKNNIKLINGSYFYILKDESDIFDIADKYYFAIEQNKEDEYWKNFQ